MPRITILLSITLLISSQGNSSTTHHLIRRSPLDIRPSFANFQHYLIPHHVATVYSPVNQNQITSNHIQTIDKKNDNLFLVALPPATSNMHHSSIHTDIKHIVKHNVKYPVITQSVSHHSTNITHPSPFLINVPSQQNSGVLVHDLTVIPLHKEAKHIDNYEDVYKARFRKFYGGFGQGLSFGGHGTGHGFFAYG